MTAAALLAEIEQADGKIWMDGDRLKFRAVPARLVPLIRAQKPELIALLSAPAQEDDLPPTLAECKTFLDVLRKTGFTIRLDDGGQLRVDPPEMIHDFERWAINLHKDGLLALLRGIDATQPARVDSGQDMALPERVTCGSCVRFQPGTTKMGIGVCLATVTGQPPPGKRGDYRAAFPMAPRSCPDYLGSPS